MNLYLYISITSEIRKLTQRRQKFEFAMAINTTVGVGAANLKLDAVNEQSAELNLKYVVLPVSRVRNIDDL